MNRRVLKIIVAVWAYFVSVDQVLAFFAGNNGAIDWSNPVPYLAIILFAAGVLILIPGLDKLDQLLVVVIIGLFGFFVVNNVIAVINSIGSLVQLEDGIIKVVSRVTAALKDIFFNLVPAALGVMYLTKKSA